jgi:hypothetical protein
MANRSGIAISQAPFAKQNRQMTGLPFDGGSWDRDDLLRTICLDAHRAERIVALNLTLHARRALANTPGRHRELVLDRRHGREG